LERKRLRHSDPAVCHPHRQHYSRGKCRECCGLYRHAECHQNRKHHALGKCHRCYENNRRREVYRDLRDRGFPSWYAAQKVNHSSYAQQLESSKKRRIKHPEQHAHHQRTYTRRIKEKFGGRIDTSPVARMRWAMEKNEKMGL
jgi:hypothetical protein